MYAFGSLSICRSVKVFDESHPFAITGTHIFWLILSNELLLQQSENKTEEKMTSKFLVVRNTMHGKHISWS